MTNDVTENVRFAGPILRSGEMSDLLVEAIQDDNPEVEVRVHDHNGYIRVEGADGLILRAATASALLGRPYLTNEIEMVMTGFSGRVEITDDHVRWYFATLS